MTRLLVGLLIAISFLFLSCEKEKPFEFTLSGYYFQASTPADCWVIFHELNGKVLDIQRFYPKNGQNDYQFNTTALEASGKCNVTIASYTPDNSHLSMITFPAVTSGNFSFQQYLSVGSSTSQCVQLACDLTISHAPETESLACLSGDKVILENNPPTLKALLAASCGGSGIGFALKPKNETALRYYWLPENGRAFFADTIDYSLFQPDWPAIAFSFPFESRWEYHVKGVATEGIDPVYGYLGYHEAKNADPLTNNFSCVRPPQVPFASMWVSAYDVLYGKYYESALSPSDAHSFPDIPFEAKSLDFHNGPVLYCSTQGDFDALQVYLYGDGGKVYWSVEGAPEDVKNIAMPQVPDSLKQQWPKLNAFTIGYTICGEIEGVDGYAGLRQLDPVMVRTSTYWRAKKGYRAKIKQWN